MVWIGKDRETEGAVVLQAFPRQLRRVGADGDHPRANLVEEGQILLEIEKLPDAAWAVVAVVEDQYRRTAVQQCDKVPDFALVIGKFEVGRLLAQERVVMGGYDVGMRQDLLE